MANLILPFTSVIYNSGVILKNRKLLRLLFLQSKFHLKNVSVVGHMIGVVYDSRVVLIRKLIRIRLKSLTDLKVA